MPTAIRVVDRLQDLSDVQVNPADGKFLLWDSATQKFIQPSEIVRSNGEVQIASTGSQGALSVSYSGSNRAAIRIDGGDVDLAGGAACITTSGAIHVHGLGTMDDPDREELELMWDSDTGKYCIVTSQHGTGAKRPLQITSTGTTILAHAANQIPLVVKAATSQTANIFEIQDASGSAISGFNASGVPFGLALTTPGGSNGQIQYNNSGAFAGVVGSSYSSGQITLQGLIVNDSSGLSRHVVTIQSASNQGSGYSLRFTDTSGSFLSGFNVSGDLYFGSMRSVGFVNNSSIGDPAQIINSGGNGLGIKTNGTLQIAVGGSVSKFVISPNSPNTLITAAAATHVPLSIKLEASQSANAFEINSNSGSGGDILRITSVGNIYSGSALTIGTLSGGISLASWTGYIHFTPNIGIPISSRLSLDNTGIIGWTQYVNNWTASVDVAIGRNAAGVLEINSGILGQYRDLKLRNLTATASSATDVPLTLKLASSQSANAFEINSSSGSGGDLLKVTATGKIEVPTFDFATPTIAFAAEPNSGIYRQGASQWGFSVNGNSALHFYGHDHILLRSAGNLWFGNYGGCGMGGHYGGPINFIVEGGASVLTLGTSIPSVFYGGTYGDVTTLIIKGANNHTTTIAEWQSYSGVVRASINHDGATKVIAGSAATIPLTLQLAATPTANAFEINSSSGSGGNLFKIASTGAATVTTTDRVAATFLGSNTNDSMIVLQNTATNGRNWAIRANASGAAGQNGAFIIYDGTASSPRFTITSAGLSGISTDISGLTVGAQLHVKNTSAGTIGQIIELAASQSANALEIRNSSGTAVSGFNASGAPFGLAQTSPGGSSGAVQYNSSGSFAGFGSWNGSTLQVVGNIAAVDGSGYGLDIGYDGGGFGRVRALTSGASYGLNFDAGNYAFAKHKFIVGGTERLTITNSGGLIGVNKTSSIGAQLHVASSSASTIGVIIQTAASPSANALELQDSSGNKKFAFTQPTNGNTVFEAASANSGFKFVLTHNSPQFQMLSTGGFTPNFLNQSWAIGGPAGYSALWCGNANSGQQDKMWAGMTSTFPLDGSSGAKFEFNFTSCRLSIGGGYTPYNTTYAIASSPSAAIIAGTSGSGTNIAGGSLTLEGGIGTGTGVGGSVLIKVAAAGSTGATLNSLSTLATFSPGNNIEITSVATGLNPALKITHTGAGTNLDTVMLSCVQSGVTNPVFRVVSRNAWWGRDTYITADTAGYNDTYPAIVFSSTGSFDTQNINIRLNNSYRTAQFTTDTATFKSKVECLSQSASHIPLTVKGAASQTSNLVSIQDNGGTSRAWVTAAGYIENDPSGTTNGVALGVPRSIGSPDQWVAIGKNTRIDGGASVAVGFGATAGYQSVAVGQAANVGNYSVAIGTLAGTNGTSGGIPGGTKYESVIVIGWNIYPSANNQMILGNGSQTDVWINGNTNAATPWTTTVYTADGNGTDKQGCSIKYAPGRSTGSATPGTIALCGTTAGVSSATKQTLVDVLTINNANTITLADAVDIVLNTTTGTKIGTATTQKLAFFNATPIVQPANTSDIRTALINLGLVASGGANPLDLNGGILTASQVGVNKTSSLGAQLHVVASSSSTIGQIIETAANPSANALELRDSAGNTRLMVSQPTAGATVLEGRSQLPSGFKLVCNVTIGRPWFQIISTGTPGAPNDYLYQSWAIGGTNASNAAIWCGDWYNNQNQKIWAGLSSTFPATGVGAKFELNLGLSRLTIGGGSSAAGETYAISTSPSAAIIAGTSGSGTNIAGGSLTLEGGIGTGTGAGGSVLIKVATAGSTGSTLNTLSTVATFSPTSPNVLIQAISATHVPLSISLASTPTANAFEIKNSSGTSLVYFNPASSGDFRVYNPADTSRYLQITHSGSISKIYGSSRLELTHGGDGLYLQGPNAVGLTISDSLSSSGSVAISCGSATRAAYAGAGLSSANFYIVTANGYNDTGRVDANPTQFKTGHGASSSARNAGNGGNFIFDLGCGGVGTGYSNGINGRVIIRKTSDGGSPAGDTSYVLQIQGGTILDDACDINFGTTTGTKIGTATTQKLAFWNATPIIQPANTTDIKDVLENTGLLASGGATPLNLDGGTLTAGRVHANIATFSSVSSTPVGTTQSIDWSSNSKQKLNLGSASGDVTLTFSANPASDCTLRLEVVQGATARDIIFPNTVKWDEVNGQRIWTLDANKTVFIYFEWNGTYYFATATEAFA